MADAHALDSRLLRRSLRPADAGARSAVLEGVGAHARHAWRAGRAGPASSSGATDGGGEQYELRGACDPVRAGPTRAERSPRVRAGLLGLFDSKTQSAVVRACGRPSRRP